jgi:AraC family transcriptional regulator of adaptative response/methylated-DNA-[protein]-cysteine methyltransferase
MRKNSFSEQEKHYATVARAIGFIRTNPEHQPSLAEIAASVNLSEYHLQHIFAAWAGISPKRFLQYLTKEHAKLSLQASADMLTTILETGLSSPGRSHNLMISREAVTPREIKAQGHGVSMTYGMASTPFGVALIAWTPRGICYLAFCDENCAEKHRELFSEWPAATLQSDNEKASRLAESIFPSVPRPGKPHLILRGTHFQIKVWEALLNIGPSQLITYRQLARLSGSPHAQRAIGHALAANNIGFLIPCHRVIRGNGDVGSYRWGTHRKTAIHVWEAARCHE